MRCHVQWCTILPLTVSVQRLESITIYRMQKTLCGILEEGQTTMNWVNCTYVHIIVSIAHEVRNFGTNQSIGNCTGRSLLLQSMHHTYLLSDWGFRRFGRDILSWKVTNTMYLLKLTFKEDRYWNVIFKYSVHTNASMLWRRHWEGACGTCSEASAGMNCNELPACPTIPLKKEECYEEHVK